MRYFIRQNIVNTAENEEEVKKLLMRGFKEVDKQEYDRMHDRIINLLFKHEDSKSLARLMYEY